MLHRHTSSKSSNENLQINLLEKNARVSRVNICRTHYPRPDHRSSAQLYNSYHNQDYIEKENKDNQSENYSTTPVLDRPFSGSILTEPTRNFKIIGVILLVLLVLLTPGQVFALVYLHKQAYLGNILENLLISELITLGVLIYMGEIEKKNLKRELFQNNREIENFSIANRPWLLIISVIASAFLWQISYGLAVQNHQSIHQIFFYLFILPYVTMFLVYEDIQGKDIKKVLYCGLILSLLVIIPTCPWLLLGSVSSLYCIYCFLKIQSSLYIEYFTKLVLLICVLVFGPSERQSTYIIWRPLVIVILVFLIITCRFVNSKYIRQQLYRYYYTDANLNCLVLLSVIGIGICEKQINILVGICCLIFAFISYKVGKDKMEVIMNDQ